MKVDLKRMFRFMRKMVAAGAIAAATLAGGIGSACAALVLSNGSFASPNVGGSYGYYSVGSSWNVHNLGPAGYGGGDHGTGSNGNLVQYAQNNVDAGLPSGSQYAAAVLWDTPAQVFSQPAGTVLSGSSGMYVDQTLGSVTSTDLNASFTLSANMVRILANPTVAGAGVTIGFANATTGVILAEKTISYSTSYAANDPTTVNIADALAWSPSASGLAIGTPVSAFIGFRLDSDYSNQYNSVALASLLLTDNIKSLTWTGADPAHATQWSTSSGVLNWSSSGTASAYSDGLHTVFDDSVGTGSTMVNISAGNVAPASVTFNNNTKNYTLSGAYGITGAAGLTMTGSGMLTITNSNNYTGDTTISNGTLQLGTGVSGQDGVIAGLVVNNSVLVYNLAGNQTPGYLIGGKGSVIKSGSGTLTFNNAQGYAGGTTVNGGTLALGVGGYGGTLQGSLTINSGGTVLCTVGDSLGYGGANWVQNININGGVLSTSFAGNNGWGLNVTMTAGTMSSTVAGGLFTMGDSPVINVNAASVPSVISSDMNIREGGPGLVLNVTRGSRAMDLLISGRMLNNSTNGVTINGNGITVLTGANTYAGATTISGGTLQLGDGTSGHDGSINSTNGVTNNAAMVYNLFGNQSAPYAISGGGDLIKLGPGQLTLAGNNSYSGTTYVSGGILNINGGDYSTGISANGGAVYVNTFSPATSVSVAGGATLGGIGSLPSAAANVANGGILDFSQNAGSTFMLAGVSYAGSGSLKLGALTTGNANVPFLQSVGDFTTAGQININANLGAVSVLSGTYDLFSFGSIAGTGTSAFHLSVNGLSSRQNATLLDVSNQIYAVIGGQTPYWGGSQPDWLSTNAWTLQPSGTLTTFLAGDSDIFDDTAGTGTYAGVVALNSGNVAPASVTFNNLGLSYTVSGNYGITGSGALAVQGGGTITLINSNNYTGATIVNNGTLQLGNSGAIGSLSPSSTISLGTNGVLAFSRSNTAVQGVDFSSSPIGGAGSLVQMGPGALILTATNTYTGTTTISGGTLQLGTGASGQDGAIAGPVIDNSTLVYNLYGNQVASYSVSGSGNLIKNGTNKLTLSGTSSTYSGGTTVNGGLLLVTTGFWYTPRGIGTGMLTINPGAAAEFTQAHGFGYSEQGQPATINRGTLVFDAENYVSNLYMTGGTLTGAGETRGTGGTINTNASTVTSVIANGTNLSTGALTYNVTAGSAGADLLVIGSIYGSSSGNALTINGNGLTVLTSSGAAPTSSNSFSGDLTVNGGTLEIAAKASAADGSGNATSALGLTSKSSTSSSSRNINVNAGATLLIVAPNATAHDFYWTGVPTLNINGGTVTNAESGGLFPAGQLNNALNNVNLNNGLLTATTGEKEPVGPGYAAWNINGTITSNGNSLISTSDPVNGTVMFANAGASTGTTTINVASGTLTVSVPLVQDDADNQVSGLLKSGTGTMVLSGTNTYTGGTTVTDGTLIATSSKAIQDGTNLAVGDPALLALLPAPVIPAAAVPAAVAPVPEPGTLTLLAAGVTMALVAVRRRSRRTMRR